MAKNCMIAVAVLLFVVFLLSPGTALSFFDWFRIPKDEQAVNDLLGRIAKSLVKRHPIRPIGTSVAMPEGDVRMLGLQFQIRGPLTKAELRAITVDYVQVFLSHVNADEKVRPSLNHYPFGVEDLGMSIFVIDPTGREVEAPDISVVHLWKGDLVYRILQNDKDGMPVTEEEIIESYAEALEAMKREQGGADK